MEELKLIIANNIQILRKRDKLTQAEMAERLNYSDKAISKWERGESVPDVAVLKQIADMFGVKVDWLLTEDHTVEDNLIRETSLRPSPQFFYSVASYVVAFGYGVSNVACVFP